MGVIIVIIIVGFVSIIWWSVSSNEKDEQRKSVYHKNNNIPKDTDRVFCTEFNGNKLEKHLEIWKDDNCIKLCDSFINYIIDKENFNKIVEKTIISIESIKFFTRDGEYRVDNIVEGGGVNLTGAIVGGVIAGGAGAIVGGRKKVTTTTKEIDERKTYLYYKENNEEKRLVLFSESYDVLLKLIPNKDFGYIEKNKIVESSNTEQSNETKENTVYKDIEELARLKDKGVLTEEEFNEKKKVLLKKII